MTAEPEEVLEREEAGRPWKLWQMGKAAVVDRLRALPPVKRQAVFDMIREKHGLGALVDVRGDRARFWYRPEQLVTLEELKRKKMVLFVGNRGDGKTDSAVYLFDWLVRNGIAKHPRIFAANADDVKKIVVFGLSGIMQLYERGDPRRPRWMSADGHGTLRYPNGVVVNCYSAEVKKGSVGHAGDVDLYDDVTKWSGKEDAWNHARTSCREGIGLGIVATSTGEGEQDIWNLIEGSAESSTTLIKRLGGPDTDPPTRPNLFNLSYRYYEQMAEELGDTDFYRREMLGEKVSEQSPFTGLDFDTPPIRIHTAPRSDFEKVVIAVDPAEGKGGDHDEWGIGAAGRRFDKHIVALDDASGSFDDDEAAAEVIRMCKLWGTNEIIVENNRGQHRVKNAIEAAYYRLRFEATQAEEPPEHFPELPRFHPTNAKEGKVLRAGPLRVLYLQGTLHHVAGLRELERQQREWKPKGPRRPRQDDRIDWLVHAVQFLAGLGDVSTTRLEHIKGLGDRVRKLKGKPPRGDVSASGLITSDQVPPGDPRSSYRPRRRGRGGISKKKIW